MPVHIVYKLIVLYGTVLHRWHIDRWFIGHEIIGLHRPGYIHNFNILNLRHCRAVYARWLSCIFGSMAGQLLQRITNTINDWTRYLKSWPVSIALESDRAIIPILVWLIDDRAAYVRIGLPWPEPMVAWHLMVVLESHTHTNTTSDAMHGDSIANAATILVDQRERY